MQAEPDQSQRSGAGPPRRPGALTFLLVMALVLGSFGVIGSVVGLVQGTKSRQETVDEATAGASLFGQIGERQLRAMREMAADTYDAIEPYRPWNLALSALNLALSALLIAGAALAFKGRERGRSALAWTAAAHLLFEPLRAALAVVIAGAQNEVISEHMPAIQAAASDTAPPLLGPQPDEIVGGAAKVGTAVGIGVSVALACAMLGFYVWMTLYLRGERARSCFR
ncbi:MAG: hypothetical protein R6V85_13950 [Polyangia bacterium]